MSKIVKKHKFLHFTLNQQPQLEEKLDELAKEEWELVFVNLNNQSIICTLQKNDFVKNET